ncbi:MAG: DNA polymerase I, partial [Oscillospiraceae bacterium]|nr:DNA polymerase I [Oscillospiraceae bacterium]
GGDTVIVTGDKDSLQLIDGHTTVKLVTTRMGQTTTRNVTPDDFRAEYGFDPIHMIDLKALMGDTSDNYPGVKGVGEKTALALVRLYHTVAHLYDHMPDICSAPNVPAKPGLVKKLAEGEDSARLCYDLATIRCDAPMGFDPADTARQPFNGPVLYEKLLQLEFTKLIDKLKLTPGPAETAAGADPVEVRVDAIEVLTEQDFQTALAKWEAADWTAVLPLPGLEGVAVSLEEDGGAQAYLYDIRASRYEGDYHALLAALFGPTVKKVTHGVKELCRSLLDEGIEPDGFVFDTELAAYLLDPTAGSYELRKLVVSYFKKEVELNAAYKDETAFSLLDDGLKAQISWYEDAAWISAFYGLFKPKLEEFGLLSVLTEIELPLCPVLARMERAGVLVDGQALVDFGKQLQTGIDVLTEEIYALAGEKFNILSPKQLGHILFEVLELPPVKKTKTGWSTNAEVLEKLRPQHEIVGRVLDYRQLTKLNSTYVEGLGKVIAADGRIHTSFQNTVTATGRLSSIEPNLQNIPVRTPLGAEMRKMFVAPAGKVLVDADYSQIELRLLAHMSGDSAMIAGFHSG